MKFFRGSFLLSLCLSKVFAADGAVIVDERVSAITAPDYHVRQDWTEKRVDNLHTGGREITVSRTIEINVKGLTLSISYVGSVLWVVSLPTTPANEYEFEEYARKCGNTAQALINRGRYQQKTQSITFEAFLSLAGVARVHSASDLVGNLPWFYRGRIE